MDRLKITRLWIVLGVLVCGPSLASAQEDAIAPLSHDRHTYHHNPPHPVVSDGSRFITNRPGAPLALPTEDDAFVFAVFGDRTGGPNEGVDVLAQAVADVNLLEPDLVMTVGDMIDGYNETPGWLQQMNQFKAIMSELICPWFPVAGNHDIYWRDEEGGETEAPVGEHEKSYELHFGPLWYAFDHKGSRFIVLYSDEGDPETGRKAIRRPETQRMSPEQLAWLKQTLEGGKDADHIFIFLHHPRWIGGGYGDDWDKVHPLLVEAGNVTAVFAGHIHRMRYDPRDGIEYITLATIGGGQRGTAPKAGWLHQYHLVTVRKQQVALAAIPVGEALDVRNITGEVSLSVEALTNTAPRFGAPLEVTDDGSVEQTLQITLSNPTQIDVEFEVTPTSDDGRWTFVPDHTHGKLTAGEAVTLDFHVARPGGSLDASARPVYAAVGLDLLTDRARFPIPTETYLVPGSLVLAAPPVPAQELVLHPGERGAATVPMAGLAIESGPVTLECFVHPTAFDRRDGIVGSPSIGFWFNQGRPVFYVFVDGRWADVEYPADAAPFAPNQTYHFAGTWDQHTMRFYIDGELIAEAAAPGELRVAGNPFTVGADSGRRGPRNSLDGWIDGVRLSDTVRYTDEGFVPVRRMQTDDNTLLLLQMDAAQGEYLYDHSGRAAHPTLREGATVGAAAE
ncbi:MAG: LamG-like jellyroll fold domain-containing protein [Planctomycetota bacterium]